MRRILIIALAAAGACVPAKPAATGPKPVATEAEWAAAGDLATTLAQAAGGERLAPIVRVREPVPMSSRHITLAAAGCYHIGIAWTSSVDVEASVIADAGTPAKPPSSKVMTAPGGTVDFCTSRAGGVALTLREVAYPDRVAPPSTFEYAIVYGSGKAPRRALARAR